MSFCVLMYVFKAPSSINCNLNPHDPRKWGVAYKQDRKWTQTIKSALKINVGIRLNPLNLLGKRKSFMLFFLLHICPSHHNNQVKCCKQLISKIALKKAFH